MHSGRSQLTKLDLFNAISLQELHISTRSWTLPTLISDLYYDMTVSFPPRNTNQLKVIQLRGGITSNSMAAAVKDCSRLDTLFWVEDSNEQVSWDHLPHNLPSLRFVRLSPSTFLPMDEPILAPHLEHLELIGCEYIPGLKPDWLERFSASFTQLRYFRLGATEGAVSTSALVKFLQLHPTLEEVHLQHHALSEQLVAILGDDSLPRLSMFSCQISQDFPSHGDFVSAAQFTRTILASRESRIASPLEDRFHLLLISRAFRNRHASRYRMLMEEAFGDDFPGVVSLDIVDPEPGLWGRDSGFGTYREED